MDEKRIDKRYFTDLLISAASGSDSYTCQAVDISLSGVKLIFPTNFKGQDFELSLSFDKTFISVPATIRWSDQLHPNHVGMKFTAGLKALDTYMLLRYIKRNESV